MSTSLLPHHFTVAEAATELGCDPSQVRRYILDGKLEAVNLGHQKVIRKTLVYAFTPDPPGNPTFQPVDDE